LFTETERGLTQTGLFDYSTTQLDSNKFIYSGRNKLQTVNKPREDDVEYELLHSFEYSEKSELKSGSKSVKGRLKLHSEFWEMSLEVALETRSCRKCWLVAFC
jgi:hypothetical protein